MYVYTYIQAKQIFGDASHAHKKQVHQGQLVHLEGQSGSLYQLFTPSLWLFGIPENFL